MFDVFTSNDDYLIREDMATENMNIKFNVEEYGNLEITTQESIGLYEDSEGHIRIGLTKRK